MGDSIVTAERLAVTLRLGWNRARWFGRQVADQFVTEGCLKNAAALTYTTLFAIVPLMTVGYRVMSLLPDLSDVGLEIQAWVFDNFVPESSALLQEKLREFSEQARDLTFVGAVFLGITAFTMLVTIEQAFNEIWQVPQPRRGLQRFMTYWAVLTFGPPLIGAGFLVSTYLFSLPLVADIDTLGVRATVLVYLPAILSFVAFTMLYYAVPNCRVPFLHAVCGGFFAMLGLEICKAAFAFAVANSNMTLIYGTFAAVPLFLLWLYLVWAVVLSGAIFVHTLSLSPEPSPLSDEPALIACLRVLSVLRRVHAEGRGATEAELATAVPLTRRKREQVFSVLDELKLTHRTDSGELALGRSLQAVTLWSLYERLPEGVPLTQAWKFAGLPLVSKRLEAFVADGNNRLGVSLDDVLKEEGA